MNARTLGFFLIAIAFISLLTEIEWLFIAFTALGLGVIIFYKDYDGKADAKIPKAEAKPQPPAPPRVIIVQQASQARSPAEEVLEDVRLDKMTGRTRKMRKEINAAKEEVAKQTASLKKELASLKKKLDDKKK